MSKEEKEALLKVLSDIRNCLRVAADYGRPGDLSVSYVEDSIANLERIFIDTANADSEQ